jgi:hypothetical protein
MDLLNDFDLSLTPDDVLRGQGADPERIHARKPALLNAASMALQEGFPILHPAAMFHHAKVIEHRHERVILEGGNVLAGPLVAHHLAGAEQVVLVLATIGADLEQRSSTLMGENPLLGLALDGLGNAAVEFLGQQVCSRIGERAGIDGLTASTPLSPGEPDWPVEVGQPQIFALLDPSQIGIQLTSGGMMVPKKSISFVVGIGPKMAQTDLCDLCSLRERCRYRHD